ncbi:MAG: LPS assembly lipoprotein LptE [Isosphaeraceae bacterium]
MRCPVRPARLVAVLVLATAASGCGYSVRAPFDDSIRTVHVPVFRSISFRRDVNLQLTDLVVKEIERRTPYKVVGNPDEADTILDGTINFADKNIVVESPFNLPRQLTAQINASVNWTHNPPLKEELDRGPTTIAETINFVPEIGETSAAAFYRVNQKLAQQIVDMMEKPW